MNTAPTLDPAAQTLFSELDQITYDSGVELVFSGVSFLFFLCKPDPTEPPAWYRRSGFSGYEVYVQDGGFDKPRLAFHEVIEASLVHQHMSVDDAHEFAREQEELVFGPRAAA